MRTHLTYRSYYRPRKKNTRINDNLEQQAQALFKSWFVDFEPWGGKMPSDWKKRERLAKCAVHSEKKYVVNRM